MRDETKSKLIISAGIAIFIILLVALFLAVCEDVRGEETLVNKYPFWVEDSTFQTVQIIKCWEIFPDGQRITIGYRVVVDSSGVCIYEEKPVWFLRWATIQALSLRDRLAKDKQKGDWKMRDSKGNEFGVGDKLKSSQSLPNVKANIECVAINKNVARMRWIHGGEFNVDQKNLLTSSWVKVE